MIFAGPSACFQGRNSCAGRCVAAVAIAAVCSLVAIEYVSLLDDRHAVRSMTVTAKHPASASSLRFCREPAIFLPNGNGLANKNITYNCAGLEYEAFGESLAKLAALGRQGRELWGTRAYPLPAGTSVLVIGNSYTRQVTEALICQYSDRIIDGQLPNINHGWVRFSNNATLHFAINDWVVHIPEQWRTKLVEQSIVGRTWNSFDLLLLGNFNDPGKPGSNYHKQLRRKKQKVPEIDLTYAGPNITEALEIFNNPIIYLSSFLPDDMASMQKMIASAAQSRVASIDSREFVGILGEAVCPGPAKQSGDHAPSLTHDSSKFDHRCTGTMGGHPDLIAWNVIEQVYSFLPY